MIYTQNGERMCVDRGGNVCRWHEWPVCIGTTGCAGLWIVVRYIADALG